MMDQERNLFKAKEQFEELITIVLKAAKDGTEIKSVEENLWRGLLTLGQRILQGYVDEQGSGDLGATLEHEGKSLRRLNARYEKRYISVFGAIQIKRTVYGSRQGQKHEMVPLDARLNLPASDFSFLLQDWSQAFCVQSSYNQSCETIERILGIGHSVRSLETMNNAMAGDVKE